MPKMRNFTLWGDALTVTAAIGPDCKPRYSVNFRNQFDKEWLSAEEFEALRTAMHWDASCSGVMYADDIDRYNREWGDEDEEDF